MNKKSTGKLASDDAVLTLYTNELLNSIPIVKSMELNICDIDDFLVSLSAPLATHKNYEGTAFGGSLNTVCVLSCYLLVHHLLRSRNVKFSSLVIQDSTIEYLHPVSSDFIATAQVAHGEVDGMLSKFNQRRRARVTVESAVRVVGNNAKLVSFAGRFVITQ